MGGGINFVPDTNVVSQILYITICICLYNGDLLGCLVFAYNVEIVFTLYGAIKKLKNHLLIQDPLKEKAVSI